MNNVNYTEKLKKLVEFGATLSTIQPVDNLLLYVTEKAVDILEAERASIYLVDRELNEIYCKVSLEVDCELFRLKMGQGIVGSVIETGELLNISDAYSDPRFDESFDRVTGFKTREVLCVPMRDQHEEVVGAVEVMNKRNNEFNNEDIDILKAFSFQIATAVENTRLISELREAHNHLQKKISQVTRLYEMEMNVISAYELQQILEIIITESMSLVGTESASIILIDDASQEFYFKVALGPKGKDVSHRRFPVAEGFAGWTINKRGPFYVNDVKDDPRFYSRISKEVGYEVFNMLCVPLFLQKKIIGVLELINKEKGSCPFSDQDIDIAGIIASQAVKAIDKAQILAELVKSEKFSAIGMMASGIIHDIRGPMAIIRGYSAFLCGESLPENKRIKYANYICREIERFTRMTEDILDYVQDQDMKLCREKVSLKEFMGQVSNIIEDELRKRNIEFIIDFPSDLFLWIDRYRIERVILNLAFNAVDAMETGGKLTIRVSSTNDMVEFVVEDTGKGIPPDVVDIVFDMFTTYGKERGSGLGLAISKKIVEEHGGSLIVESEVGRGSTFYVRLPNNEN